MKKFKTLLVRDHYISQTLLFIYYTYVLTSYLGYYFLIVSNILPDEMKKDILFFNFVIQCAFILTIQKRSFRSPDILMVSLPLSKREYQGYFILKLLFWTFYLTGIQRLLIFITTFNFDVRSFLLINFFISSLLLLINFSSRFDQWWDKIGPSKSLFLIYIILQIIITFIPMGKIYQIAEGNIALGIMALVFFALLFLKGRGGFSEKEFLQFYEMPKNHPEKNGSNGRRPKFPLSHGFLNYRKHLLKFPPILSLLALFLIVYSLFVVSYHSTSGDRSLYTYGIMIGWLVAWTYPRLDQYTLELSLPQFKKALIHNYFSKNTVYPLLILTVVSFNLVFRLEVGTDLLFFLGGYGLMQILMYLFYTFELLANFRAHILTKIFIGYILTIMLSGLNDLNLQKCLLFIIFYGLIKFGFYFLNVTMLEKYDFA